MRTNQEEKNESNNIEDYKQTIRRTSKTIKHI